MQIAWDARRGYMTCLCTPVAGEPLAIVWDLHSGQPCFEILLPCHTSHLHVSAARHCELLQLLVFNCHLQCGATRDLGLGQCLRHGLQPDCVAPMGAGTQDRAVRGPAAHVQFAHAEASPPANTGHRFFQQAAVGAECRLPEGLLLVSVPVRELLSVTSTNAGMEACGR